MAGRAPSSGCYDWLHAASEARGLAARRHRLIGSARGQVLEIGAGTGPNVRHYRPNRVDSLLALEPNPDRRERFALRAATAPFPLEFRVGAITDADLDDAAFDTVVATLVLCRVADPAATVAAIARVLVPGGRLLLLEHVLSPGPLGRLQRGATPAWAALSGGCHLDRDTLARVRAAGLNVADCTRFALPGAGPLRPLFGSCVEAVAWQLPVGDPDPAMSALAPRGPDAA